MPFNSRVDDCLASGCVGGYVIHVSTCLGYESLDEVNMSEPSPPFPPLEVPAHPAGLVVTQAPRIAATGCTPCFCC